MPRFNSHGPTNNRKKWLEFCMKEEKRFLAIHSPPQRHIKECGLKRDIFPLTLESSAYERKRKRRKRPDTI